MHFSTKEYCIHTLGSIELRIKKPKFFFWNSEIVFSCLLSKSAPWNYRTGGVVQWCPKLELLTIFWSKIWGVLYSLRPYPTPFFSSSYSEIAKIYILKAISYQHSKWHILLQTKMVKTMKWKPYPLIWGNTCP